MKRPSLWAMLEIFNVGIYVKVIYLDCKSIAHWLAHSNIVIRK